MTNLVGKNILIVDEVDDTRTTLEYAVRELQKDVETAAQKLGSSEKTQFSIFVLHVEIHIIPVLIYLILTKHENVEQGQSEKGSSAAGYDG